MLRGDNMNLTKYEFARVIGARALQLEMGAPPLIPVRPEDDVITVALREYRLKVLPLTVIRE